MTKITRRDVIGTVGAATLLAGCSESSSTSSGGFTETTIDDQQLIVKFEESLEAETISVIDPAGESFAETSVATGASRVTFDISIPYTPGEYRLIAAADGETLAETTQTIQPELEIVDVGVGANRLDEMPSNLGHARMAEAIVSVQNIGTGPEMISQLRFRGDLPNPRNLSESRIGIYNSESGGEIREPIVIGAAEEIRLISSTLPFTFQGNGINCQSEPQSGEITVELGGEIDGDYSKQFLIGYTASESFSECNISLQTEE